MAKTPAKKTKRGPRGQGSVFPDPRTGGWRGRRPVGKHPDGRTRYVERTGKTQREVLDKLARATPPGPGTTVGQWAARWLEDAPVRDSTRADYRETVRRFVVPTLGGIRLMDLTAHHVETAVRKWKLGANTARKNAGHLATLLQAAVRAELIPRNPATHAKKPRPKPIVINPFTADELARIVREATPHRHTRPFALLAVLGCRLGEVLALDVQDVKGDTVGITKTYSRRHGLRPPKSERGVRTLRVAGVALPALTAAVAGRRAGPLFPTPRGKRRQHSTVQKGWASFLKRLDLPYRGVHSLRHSVASAMVAAGVPLPDVSRFLGDTLAVVVRRYLHPTSSDPVAALDRVFGAG